VNLAAGVTSSEWGQDCPPDCYLCRVGAGGTHRAVVKGARLDPNQTLKEIRDIVGESERKGATPTQEQAERLVELAAALDRWLSSGGFLPRAWQR
jgi:hypothetical protein